MLMLVSPFWSSQIQRPDRYVVRRASASSLTVLEVSAGSHSAATSAGSLIHTPRDREHELSSNV